MRVGICDDDVNFIIKVRDWLKSNHPEIHSECVHTFYCGEALLSFMSANSLDILFLDCELGSMNGLEIAERIRKRDRNLVIIAVSNYVEYAADGYGAIHRYILKGNFSARISAAFNEAVMVYKSNNDGIINVKIKTDILRVPTIEILYFESKWRQLFLHMQGDFVHEFYGRLDEYENELKSLFFIRIHQSYIVNCKHIGHFTREGVTMSDGKSLPVSRGKYTESIDRFTLYCDGVPDKSLA